MTTLAQPASLGGPSSGGVPARRALVRWALRMFRREWRQQLLVVTLLTIAVAAAIGSITLVYNTGLAVDSEFGSANTVLEFDGTDPPKLQAGLASARRSFGTIDVIGHRSVAVPGSVDKVDFRSQDPHGAYGGELLALRRGRYPQGRGEVAVTDGVAKLLRLELGSTLALDGLRRTVVGIVENPRELSDEFALTSLSSATTPDHVSVLVNTSRESVESFFGPGNPPPAYAGTMLRGSDRPPDTLAMFSVATVFLLLASLIAAAGFAAVAQRRLRQLGMLAAIGATQKHLRLVLLANGAIVGAIAALCGTIVGLALWVAAGPTLESAVDHRVERLSLPWELIAVTLLIALFGATAAAWWPGRTVARLPVALALSGRPPKPRPARHSAFAAAALIAAGIGCLALSNRDRPPLIVAGLVAAILGCLLLGPLAIRLFSRLAGRVSIAPRLALRDLVRYQARSGAALAAVTLALGIAATIVVIASAEEAESAAQPPNLSDRQIRVYMGSSDGRELTPVEALAGVDRLAVRVRQLTARLDRATVVPLQHAFQPGATPFVAGGKRVLPTIDLARRSDSPSGRKMYAADSQLFVATPAVLRYLGIDQASIDPSTDFLADRSLSTNGLVIPSMAARAELPVENVQKIETGQHLFGAPYESAARKPPTFITLNGLRRHGWKRLPAGWLVDSSQALTGDQIADARDLAANAGLTIEVRREAASLTKAMVIATAAGGLLALAILAMTVGLIRGESAGDLRTLTATGATSRIRRTLAAATAGALALLGALLGVAGAYVVLGATYYDDLGYLSDVPILYLILTVVGVPLAAAAAGWLLSGREPAAIARPVME
ncbi:MAG TPA: FtsX-like permease family protein [Gaiellaceae bacterium]|nr:FtsX-like permease family protein [Gaiellaceae bacterium]